MHEEILIRYYDTNSNTQRLREIFYFNESVNELENFCTVYR